jgi:hypothetical protein
MSRPETNVALQGHDYSEQKVCFVLWGPRLTEVRLTLRRLAISLLLNPSWWSLLMSTRELPLDQRRSRSDGEIVAVRRCSGRASERLAQVRNLDLTYLTGSEDPL